MIRLHFVRLLPSVMMSTSFGSVRFRESTDRGFASAFPKPESVRISYGSFGLSTMTMMMMIIDLIFLLSWLGCCGTLAQPATRAPSPVESPPSGPSSVRTYECPRELAALSACIYDNFCSEYCLPEYGSMTTCDDLYRAICPDIRICSLKCPCGDELEAYQGCLSGCAFPCPSGFTSPSSPSTTTTTTPAPTPSSTPGSTSTSAHPWNLSKAAVVWTAAYCWLGVWLIAS